ncbi:MAG: magnesium-translocating P-type ATPase [Candidatus Methanomethylicia archaeon]
MSNQNSEMSSVGGFLEWVLPSTEEILTLPVEEILSRLKTSLNGLSSEEVERRLEVFSYNEVAGRRKRSLIIEFLYHFRNPLVIILLIAGLISYLLGDHESAIIVFSIVVMSTLLDFYQEHKAERAAEMLRERVALTVTVIRDGFKREVKMSEIVPGDIILLSAGDIVPADARVINAKDLFVDQSALTGESFPVEKTPTPLKSGDLPITEWSNYLFMGTSVVSGSATAVVVRTGSRTEYGRISRALAARGPETEFQRGIRRFGYMIMETTFLLVLFIFFINALYKRDVLESLLFSVSLAVGLTPELLPMIISINLSKGAIDMSRKKVIIKRLASIQNFGSMDILCTDKTGTLTENKIRLIFHVDVNGRESEKVLLYSYLNSYYQTGLRSPLDEAVLAYKSVDIAGYRKIDEIPFDFIRKRLSIVIEHEDQRYMITKGAPEEILKICLFYELDDVVSDLTDEARKKIERKYLELSAEGYRVLGVAYKRLREYKPVYSVSDESEMVFLGFIGFLDPPKETAREAIKLLREAGVELKILTGDNELVTRKVCEHLGFEIKGILLGSEIEHMHDDALARAVEEVNVFCRVTPAQKNRIISALRANGHVVGFLGDGINDAPSLKNADVGISVDNAVDVAKEAADIILLENDLTILHDGVLEGRKTFGNAMKYILMAISSNFGNMFSVALGSLFLPFLPMLPIQILLNNLLYDLTQTAVPLDDVDREYLEKPKRWDIFFVRRFMVVFGPISSLFDFLTYFMMLLAFKAAEPLFQTAWFLESLLTQTLVVFIIRTRLFPFYRSRPSKALIFTSASVIIFALALPYTWLGAVFRFVQPPIEFYLALAAIISAYLALVEAAKSWFYRRYGHRLEQVLMPSRGIGLYLSRTMRVTQDTIAMIYLRHEDEIPINALISDLERAVAYPISPEEIYRSLQYLRRAGLVSVDWREGKIRREKAMKDYVNKYVFSELWPKILDDWRDISVYLKARYGRINQEYNYPA